MNKKNDLANEQQRSQSTHYIYIYIFANKEMRYAERASSKSKKGIGKRQD